MTDTRACPLCRGTDLKVIRRREYESRSGRKESVTYMCRKCKAIFAAYDPENPPVDASKYTKQANICFDCENAMGGVFVVRSGPGNRETAVQAGPRMDRNAGCPSSEKRELPVQVGHIQHHRLPSVCADAGAKGAA